jgi:negative regulator of sigma-B (phosphoserine phosphatase)
MVEGSLTQAPDGWPEELEIGVAGAALAGESRSGDLAVFAPYARGGLAVVIDGLGHGGDAADASAIAERMIREHADEPPATLLARCHEALRKSRGVVLTAAWFDLAGHQLSWAGVGNVEARLVRGAAVYGDRHDSALVLGGVVGYNLPAVRPSRTDLRVGDAVAFATDGIDADYSASLTPGLPAQRLAERIMERHARANDDALAAVVRYMAR